MSRNSSGLSLSDDAYNRIKNALCHGELKPGTILSENRLASEYSMSRTPVREAIHRLVQEGWLEVRSGHGTYVKHLSSKDIDDLYEVRLLLESQAAKTAVYEITDAEIDAFEQRFQELCEHMLAGKTDDQTFFDLDWEFHSLIISRCRNTYIRSIMENNNRNLRRYQRLSADTLGDIRESTDKHLHLLALIRKRDPEALSEAIAEHIRWAAGIIPRPDDTAS